MKTILYHSFTAFLTAFICFLICCYTNHKNKAEYELEILNNEYVLMNNFETKTVVKMDSIAQYLIDDNL